MNNDDLVGKHIKDARHNGESIYLNLVDGSCVSLTPYGDCCANCYIQNVDGSEALVDATVKQVEDLECQLSDEEEAEQSEYTVIDAWGHRIITDKGICNIEMRVSHNGYYGGSLDSSVGDCWSEAKKLKDF